MDGKYEIIVGDCRERLASLPEGHYHCAVTSPPYFGLRSYLPGEHPDKAREVGAEATPDEFVNAMRAVFGGAENPVGLWRVLRDDGVAWLNIGDTYAHSLRQSGESHAGTKQNTNAGAIRDGFKACPVGYKEKDLMGIPWRVVLSLQADGWYLRDAIIWHKPAPMPGSQRDRCTNAYEFIFQLTKRPRYYFDMEAIKEESVAAGEFRGGLDGSTLGHGNEAGRTPRNIWRIAHEPFDGAHFACFPSELPRRCILASTSERGCCPSCGAPWLRVTEREARKRERPNAYTKRTGEEGTGNSCANDVAGVDVRTVGWEPGCECGEQPVPCRVLDPFNGAGTTGLAAVTLGRDYTGIELNPAYAEMARKRIEKALKPTTFRDTTKDTPAPLFGNGEAA